MKIVGYLLFFLFFVLKTTSFKNSKELAESQQIICGPINLIKCKYFCIAKGGIKACVFLFKKQLCLCGNGEKTSKL